MDTDAKIQLSSIESLNFIQTEILKIVKEFDEFCTDNDIQYVIGGGTLLGAVRHKGFIPWDDDFDVYMTRSNLEKFINSWKSNLYEVISFRDKDYYKPHTPVKIHNPRFRLKELGDEKYSFPELTNYGIFIDIFVIDFYSSSIIDKLISKYFGKIMLAKFLSNYQRNIARSEVKIARFIPNTLVNMLKSIIKKRFLRERRDHVSFGWDIPFNNFFIPKNEYFPIKYYDFCGLTVPGPKNADLYLKQRYGDYNVLPPEELRHGHIISVYEKIEFHK